MPIETGPHGYVRYTREEIDRMFERGEIRPWRDGNEAGPLPRVVDTSGHGKFKDPEQRVLRAKAAAASRRRAAALRALEGDE
jgi:hypothetical protein